MNAEIILEDLKKYLKLKVISKDSSPEEREFILNILIKIVSIYPSSQEITLIEPIKE